MIIRQVEKEAFEKLLGNQLEGIITNRGVYDYRDNSIMLDKLALNVRDAKKPSHNIHYLILNGFQSSVEYLGDCGRLRVEYFLFQHIPLSKRGATVIQQLDSDFSFSYGIESRLIKAINFYGHSYNGPIRELDSSIYENELHRDHNLDSRLDDYSLNIVELVHDNSSTIIRIEESGFYVFFNQKQTSDFLLDINQDRYSLLLEVL